MGGGLYLSRALSPTLRRAAREFPVVVLTGPRQSGKTTLLRHEFSRGRRYVSLEPPDVREAALSDPRAFLAEFPPPVIFDEIQCVPELLPYIKEAVDEHRERPGQFLLTGSQNLLLMEQVTESLAGRAALLRLLPLSRRETAGAPGLPLPWESRRAAPGREPLPRTHVFRMLLRGAYPEICLNPRRQSALWHASYVETYLGRDVRGLRQVGDLLEFRRFLQALAARSGQLLNLSELSRDLGVAVNTIKAWLSVLEASYQVVVVRPYFASLTKRLVKTPKVYFTDTGTLGYLVGLRDPAHAAQGPMAGVMLETAVLGEIVKAFLNRGVEPRVHFWRTSAGSEVDFLVEDETKLVPIEVKLTATPRPSMATAIEALRRDLGSRVARGYVIHCGGSTLPLSAGALAWPFSAL